MEINDAFKIVFILDETLPVGLKANTSAVLAMTIGTKIENLLGPDVKDAAGINHVGITKYTLPILSASADKLLAIYLQAYEMHDSLLLVDFTDIAQTTHHYEEYEEKLKTKNREAFHLLGIALAGDKKMINKLTGNLPLLR